MFEMLWAGSEGFDPVKDIPDLRGKVMIVTGGSGGLGLAIIGHLARKGAKVYMAVRDDAQMMEAFERLERDGLSSWGGEVKLLELDLVDPRTAKRSAQRFMELESRLDVLVNNAALINDHGKAGINRDGLSETMAINVVGPFVFTTELLPVLKSTASLPESDVRIVNVGSDGHTFVHNPTYASLENWNNTFREKPLPSQSRYLYSKMAVHLWTNEMARRLEGTNIILLITHPGAVYSDGTKSALKTLYFSSLWIWIAGFIMTDPNICAYSSVFAATSLEVKADPRRYHGVYIKPPNIVSEQSAVASTEWRQKEVMNFIEAHLRQINL